MKKIGMYIGICTLLVSVYGCSSSDDATTSTTSKHMVAYNSLDEKEQSLTISPANSTVEEISVKDVPESELDASYDGKKVYVVTFSDTANSKHGDLVVYLDENGKKAIGKSFK
ncbi:hypothetical protein [Kurthia senegalensis]|uniref:hypothetical protein n=1 Tax=Kurthia senegalensis TaxID=1033740 RepID=UPI0002887282|nr:hypothetical protein [Kurthia senegalensis]